LLGTVVNTLAIAGGSLIGLMFRGRISVAYHQTVLHAIGLAVMLIGITSALKSGDILLIIFSLADIPKTFTTPEIRVDCPDHLKFSIVKKLVNYFKERYSVIDIDGVRVLFDGGWGLVRASNTQPALVLRFEACSETRLDEIREIVESRLREISEPV